MICEALSPPHYETAIAHVAAAAWEVWLDIEAARHAVRYRHPEPGWLLLSSKILRWWSWHNCYPTMKLVTLTRKAEWDMKYWEKEARSGNTSYVIMRSMMRMMRHQNLSTSNGQDNPDSISSFMSIMASYFNPKMSLTLFFPRLKKCSKHLDSSNRNNPFKRSFEPPQGSRRIVGGPNA